jgi:hypothetical protein
MLVQHCFEAIFLMKQSPFQSIDYESISMKGHSRNALRALNYNFTVLLKYVFAQNWKPERFLIMIVLYKTSKPKGLNMIAKIGQGYLCMKEIDFSFDPITLFRSSSLEYKYI